MLDYMRKHPDMEKIKVGRYKGNEWDRMAGAFARDTGKFLQVPDWEIALGILAWAAERVTFTVAELVAHGPTALGNLAQPELLALLEVLKEAQVIHNWGRTGKMAATYRGKLIVGAVTNQDERDAYLDALAFLNEEIWEVAYVWLIGAIDLGLVFTAMDVEAEFLSWPVPITMEEKTQTRVINMLLRHGVIEPAGYVLLQFTGAGRAIVNAMVRDVDFLADWDSKLPSGTMRAVREERRRRLRRPGAK